jgi:hypothetical protein
MFLVNIIDKLSMLKGLVLFLRLCYYNFNKLKPLIRIVDNKT